MPQLRLKNTYSKALEPFAPLDPAGRAVTMYTCGPTVYSYAHIGNFRSFLLGDLLRRVLERRGYAVRQVMNITDVGHLTEDHLADAAGEDKLARAAREIGKDPYEIAAHFERAFAEDARALGLRVYQGADAEDPALHPRATQHVPEMLAMIQALLDRGYAYLDGRGQAYFEVAKFPEYGRLSGKVLDELEAGARVAVRDEKRDPRDFALWKADDKHLMLWDPQGNAGFAPGDRDRLRALAPGGLDARLGRGFPGWHIECSAMARAHLGDLIDIHTGGEDNAFPHHECEIAQSFGAFGLTTPAPDGAADAGAARPTFARFWLHGRHLLVDGRKMSKRDGTFFTPRELFDPVANGRPELVAPLEAAGFPGGRVPPAVLRYALLSNAYAQPMNFTFDLLTQARASVERLRSCHERLREAAAGEGPDGAGEPARALARRHEEQFDAALDDDLHTPGALVALFAFVSAVNAAPPQGADAALALATLEGFDQIFGALDRRVRSGLITRAQIDARLAAEAPGQPGPAAEGPGGPDPAGDHDPAAIERAIVAREALKARAARAADKAEKRAIFARADAARADLKARGVAIEDTPQGVRWKLD